MTDSQSLSPLVFPLDVPNLDQALGLIQKIGPFVGYFKIGLELFIRQGPAVVDQVRSAAGGAGIFLDLKLSDIPATVGRAMRGVAALGVDLITVHADGGRAMMAAAKAEAGSARVLAVTVLTSIDVATRDEYRDEYRQPGQLVRFRAREAMLAGCDGLVCSGREAELLRTTLGPDPLLVTPGIRPAWSVVPGDDQSRIVTPAMAVRAGADLLVVGRPIRDAADPAEAARRVVEEARAAREKK
jgi:orotidine-5'-phosphate decarboxylase